MGMLNKSGKPKRKSVSIEPVLVDWMVRGSRVVFFELLGGDIPGGPPLFAMDADRIGLLLNADYMKEQLQESSREKPYPASWGLQEYVEVGRLLRKGLTMGQIASSWGMADANLRLFYSQSLQKFQRDRVAVAQEETRQGDSDTEKDYVTSLKPANTRPGEAPTPAKDFLEIPRMVHFLKSKGLEQTAKDLALDADDLRDWVKKNQKYLVLFGFAG